MGAAAAVAVAAPSELARIIALPRRAPVDCERERGTRRWAPASQALVEVVTEKYSRGPRLSCACRDRKVEAIGNGRLVVYHQGRPDEPPPLPLETTVEAFCQDNRHDSDTVEVVRNLNRGYSAQLPGLGHPVCMTQLNPVQAWTLRELPRAGGAFGMISVGGGKTAMGILAPLSMPERRQWILLIKPDQRLHYKRQYLRLREHFRVPSIVFDNVPGKGSYRVEGAPALHVVPYSVLQNQKSTDLFERTYKPNGILADEVHCLANIKSSRTIRFLRHMRAHNGTVFAGWTGSPIDKSIRNCAHLVAHALGLGSPFPIRDNDVEAWCAVMDPSPTPDTTSATAKALRRWFGTNPNADDKLFEAGFASDSGIREGFRERVVATPGIVSTKSSSINCSLTIRERRAPKMPDAVREALAMARQGTRPDKEELAEQTEIALCVRSVAAGYHYYWAYPKSTPEERAPGGLIDQWFAARKAWNKELRAKLLRGEVHLDSRALAENAAERGWRVPRYDGDLPVWPAESWPAWEAIKDRVEPDPRTRWVDEYLARDAAEWARENCGIVWCRSRSFGMKVAELAGLPYHGGGPDAEERILAEDGSCSVIASIRSHSEGRDGLQHKFSKQLIAELMPSGKGIEQLLGRLCRPGQMADTVETEVYGHVSEFRDDLRRAIMYARFIEATTGNQQLILAAHVDIDL